MNALTSRQRFSQPSPARSVSNPILIEIEQIDDVCLIRLNGHFNSGEYSDYLNAKLQQIKTLGCSKFLADFEDLTSVGSTGLSFIVGLHRASGGRLVLANTQPRVYKALDITRLSTVIPIAADLASGLAWLRRDGSEAWSVGSRCSFVA